MAVEKVRSCSSLWLIILITEELGKNFIDFAVEVISFINLCFPAIFLNQIKNLSLFVQSLHGFQASEFAHLGNNTKIINM